jgi:hypothetical protein
MQKKKKKKIETSCENWLWWLWVRAVIVGSKIDDNSIRDPSCEIPLSGRIVGNRSWIVDWKRIHGRDILIAIVSILKPNPKVKTIFPKGNPKEMGNLTTPLPDHASR